MLIQKPFSFVANSKNLETTIKKVASVMSAASMGGDFFLASEKKRVYVVGISNDTFVRIALHDVKADADGAFGFKPEDLCGLIKNRADLAFTFNGQACNFKQVKGPYKVDLVTVPPTGDQQSSCDTFLSAKPKVDVVMPADLLSLVKSGLSSIAIKDVYQGNVLLAYIVLNKKGTLSISSFDSQHFGLFNMETGVKGLEFKAALPASHFGLIDQIAAGVETKFTINGGSLRVEGKGFTIVLPSTQAEDSSYTMVSSFVAGSSKPVFKCEVDLPKFCTIVDNLYTLYSANTSFSVSSKDGSALNLAFTTASGSASDSMKVASKSSKAFKAGVDPRLLKDVITLAGNVKGTTIMSVSDKVFAFEGTTSEEANLFLACARAE